jgi:hypothetical protein
MSNISGSKDVAEEWKLLALHKRHAGCHHLSMTSLVSYGSEESTTNERINVCERLVVCVEDILASFSDSRKDNSLWSVTVEIIPQLLKYLTWLGASVQDTTMNWETQTKFANQDTTIASQAAAITSLTARVVALESATGVEYIEPASDDITGVEHVEPVPEETSWETPPEGDETEESEGPTSRRRGRRHTEETSEGGES